MDKDGPRIFKIETKNHERSWTIGVGNFQLIYNKISDLIYLNEIGYYSGLIPFWSWTKLSTIHPRRLESPKYTLVYSI